MSLLFCGIQQVGIGIPNVKEAFDWYRKYFGMDIPVFDEAAEARLMLPYTGGKAVSRHAILAMNLVGGGGFEIWQYTSRTPQAGAKPLELGDHGINVVKIKSTDIRASYARLSSIAACTPVTAGLKGAESFFLKDPYGNVYQVCPSNSVFSKGATENGGVYGCIIGVSDMDKSLKFYKEILGYDKVMADESGNFPDLEDLYGGSRRFRRVLLTHAQVRKGAFSKWLGPSELELIQNLDQPGVPVFENRQWGDLGFIHLCFDIKGMDALRDHCARLGSPFTVDSKESLQESFDMGDAAGHFAYIEDPDGTLIEFVETHKVPVLQRFGWYLDLKKRNHEKSLPDWIVKAMRFKRVKD